MFATVCRPSVLYHSRYAAHGDRESVVRSGDHEAPPVWFPDRLQKGADLRFKAKRHIDAIANSEHCHSPTIKVLVRTSYAIIARSWGVTQAIVLFLDIILSVTGRKTPG